MRTGFGQPCGRGRLRLAKKRFAWAHWRMFPRLCPKLCPAHCDPIKAALRRAANMLDEKFITPSQNLFQSAGRWVLASLALTQPPHLGARPNTTIEACAMTHR